MTNMKWYAVRCCCAPKKVLGFMLIPEGVTRYTVREESDEIKASHLCFKQMTVSNVKKHIIEIKSIGYNETTEYAIYSDDRPIEFWRRIHGFIEAL